MKSSSRLFPVRLHSAEARDDLLEDVYLIKPNNSPDKSVELAVMRLGLDGCPPRRPLPIVLFHGCYQNHRYWLGQNGLGPYLARQGYDVWLLDARGHGLSPRNQRFERNSLLDYSRYDLPAVLAFIAEVNGHSPVLIGAEEGFAAGLMAQGAGSLVAGSCAAILGLGAPFPSAGLGRLPGANYLAETIGFGEPRNQRRGPEPEPRYLRQQLWREQGPLLRRGRSLGIDLWQRLGQQAQPPIALIAAPQQRLEKGLQQLLEQGRIDPLGALDLAKPELFWQPVAQWLQPMERGCGVLPPEQTASAC
ncbi:MAG: lysophospholipase [Cellvibrionaceae bacterium]|nr:lysophospholipase [Cellvibrionaceae bacterium]